MARNTKRPSKARRQQSETPTAETSGVQGKRVQFDLETWQTLDLLARERMMTFQELADEAFRDLLKKHGRPYDVRDAFKKSARAAIAEAKNAPGGKPDPAAGLQTSKDPKRQASKRQTAKHQASKRKRPAGDRRARS